MVEGPVTFMARRTYLVVKGAWNDSIQGCPDFLCNKKNAMISFKG